MIYLFLGPDAPAKDAQLKRLTQELLPRDKAEFNFDTLYGRELDLHTLQERMSSLPAAAEKRVILIREAEALKEGLQEFLGSYGQKQYPYLELILDFRRLENRDEFISRISRFAKTFRFLEGAKADTFTLMRYIDQHKADAALAVLGRLLKEGERPEFILGGLRFAWEKGSYAGIEKRKRLKLLLNCDIAIKTGKLKPQFALERLVVALCCFNKASR